MNFSFASRSFTGSPVCPCTAQHVNSGKRAKDGSAAQQRRSVHAAPSRGCLRTSRRLELDSAGRARAHRQPSRLVLNDGGLADALERLGHVGHHGALAGLHSSGTARATGRRDP
jgi:hypothetical protein